MREELSKYQKVVATPVFAVAMVIIFLVGSQDLRFSHIDDIDKTIHSLPASVPLSSGAESALGHGNKIVRLFSVLQSLSWDFIAATELQEVFGGVTSCSSSHDQWLGISAFCNILLALELWDFDP